MPDAPDLVTTSAPPELVTTAPPDLVIGMPLISIRLLLLPPASIFAKPPAPDSVTAAPSEALEDDFDVNLP
jgi:hypothetical protein